MDQEELKKLHEESKRYVEKIAHAVQEVFYPQIESFKKNYNDYLKSLVATSGLVAGAVTALLSSDITKIEWLTISGFLLLVIVVISTFVIFKRGLVESSPYAQHLKEVSKELTDFSHKAVKLSRGETTPEEFQAEKQKFEQNYNKWREDPRAEKIDSMENETILNMSNKFSAISVLTFLFIFGIILVTASVIIPLFRNLSPLSLLISNTWRPISQMIYYKDIFLIIALVLQLLGTGILAWPLLHSKKDLDADLIVGEERKGEKYFYTRKGFLKDKKLGLCGLSLIGFGFLIQLFSIIL